MQFLQLELGIQDVRNIFDHLDITSTDEGFSPMNEATPTTYQPGSTEKIDILAKRLEDSESLFHPEDEKLPDQQCDQVLLGILDSLRKEDVQCHEN